MTDTSNVNPMSTVIFTDGACLGNPGPGGWGFILKTSGGHIIEHGGVAADTTNNRMELMAVIKALEVFNLRGEKSEGVVIHSDSKYVIGGITQWIRGWKIKGWKNGNNEEVKNKDLWQKLDEVVSKASKVTNVNWEYVEGHVGIPGNERCDEIATEFATGNSPYLFEGEQSDYTIDLSKTKGIKTKPPKKKSAKGKNVYYLTYYGGDIFRDKTWAECEARVKGRSGVKYKKCSSEEEEKEILKSWGVEIPK